MVQRRRLGIKSLETQSEAQSEANLPPRPCPREQLRRRTRTASRANYRYPLLQGVIPDYDYDDVHNRSRRYRQNTILCPPSLHGGGPPPLLYSKDVLRGEGVVLGYLDTGTRSLISYLAPQLELESDLGPEMRGGGGAEWTEGWDRGRLNNDGGVDGDVDADAMSRHQKQVAYKD